MIMLISLFLFWQMFPDNAVKREMIKKLTSCVNNGCTWKGNFKDYMVKTHK